MSSEERTLLIRHLPSELDDDKKTDLIKHFGASRVKIMGHRGSMKHTAFAMFNDVGTAKQALQRLHQLQVCGSRLLVEFAKLKSSNSHDFPHEGDIIGKNTEQSTSSKPDKEEKPKLPTPVDRVKTVHDEVFAKYGIAYPRNPGLTYLYPPPTVSTLTNIANALAAHPKFYVQVLHLMNKLNIPAPFGPITPTPPLADDVVPAPHPVQEPSSDESEIDSDPDTKSKAKASLKRPLKKTSHTTATKRPKYLPPPLPAPVRDPSYVTHTTEEVFDSADATLHKKINLNLPPTVMHPVTQDVSSVTAPPKEMEAEPNPEVSGFGKIEPQKQECDSSGESDGETRIEPSRFLKLSDIRANRISSSQMKEYPSFKNYKAGEPSSRIYIKNLSRKATEEDLINLFGSYSDYHTEEGKSMFYVQLMEGRMKGQAFVTLGSEVQAKSAVRDVNGYVMHGKPIAVQFARTAKPKD